MKEKQTYYLVGNAHLDPVWQWRWQEGSAEAKATVRSALDRMKEFPEFRFVCSSASVYKWIGTFAPEMFDEVRQRVAEGRWTVVGGWHVQPDCNLPSGEGFARQTLYSQRYFKEKLGVTAKVGYNVDSFGHNANLPQILRESGMDSYIFMRPGPHEKDMDSDVFEWTAPDGSSVTTYRIPDNYGYRFSSLDELEARSAFLDTDTRTELTEVPLFFGVGNHGGGPTIRNLEILRAFRDAHPEKKLLFSDLSDFFDAVRASGVTVPVYRGDLQHHASGCYATVYAVKNGIRRAEHELGAAERFSMMSSALCGVRPGQEAVTAELASAWENVCFCHFHDSMGGCSIREAYDDAALMLGSARRTAAVLENNALQTVSWQIGTPDREKGLPVVVFNPHAFPVRDTVQVNRAVSAVTDAKGRPVPCQAVHASSYECYWQKDTLFEAEVPALGYAVYYLREDGQAQETAAAVSAQPWTGFRTANEHGGTTLENEFYSIRFEEYSGYITAFTDKRTGRSLITGRAAVPVVVDEYYHDTWSHARNFFTDEMARFSDAEVTVVENGPVRATVKVVSRYNDSTLTQYFSLTAGSDRLSVRARVDWHEKHKLLKLAFPMAVTDPEAFYEIPFGVIGRPADGEEEPGLGWTAVKGSNGGWALLNDCTYSSSVKDGTLYLTLLRSPIYGDHGGPRTAESEYTDQGQMDFWYTLMPAGDEWSPLVRAAALLNKPLTLVIETWHEGPLPAVGSVLCADQPNVIVSAIKRGEDGHSTVIRLYETDGRDTETELSGPVLPVPLRVTLPAFAVRTYRLEDGAAAWERVLMSEFAVEGQ